MSADEIGSNPSGERWIGEIIEARLTRRLGLQGMAAVAGAAAMSSLPGTHAVRADKPQSSLTFEELAHGYDETIHVSPGYNTQVLLRWGDPVLADAPAFDVNNQTAAAQEQQFGYNCDFIAYLPLPRGSTSGHHGLLCVNHEYTNTHLMFPGFTLDNQQEKMTRALTEVELAAHGHSVVEIVWRGGTAGHWDVVRSSPYNRRFSTRSTEMMLSGPAAGHERLQTSTDPTGTCVMGTLNNCAGGVTPWGTVLIAEEDFQDYFSGDPTGTREERNHTRYGIRNEPEYPWWGTFFDRFNVEKEPNEPNRFGWIVEYDPYNPSLTPVKRTAAGRFRHEGAQTVLSRDGRVVLYSGDDQRFEYVYKFVSKHAYNPHDRAANFNLLDEGTLYAAKFHDDGVLEWLPIVYGRGPLTAANGFTSQADVLIETRRAADLLKATPMDRPEDIDPNPVTGRVYVALTKNKRRKVEETDRANPRFYNQFGHIIEIIPPGEGGAADHAATEARWEMFIRAGDPEQPVDGASYHQDVSKHGWFATPDNLAFDRKGRLWIATDGMPGSKGLADGIYATDTTGTGRALTKHFFRTPIGAECASLYFTSDDTGLFVSVQHPGEDSEGFDTPDTRWPDFDPAMPPRPSVVSVVKRDGGIVGS